MLILGIESTCDETACALVRDGKEILSSVISSQIDLHDTFGGVVPELACRRHVDVMIPVIDQALKEAHLTLDEIDAIAVAQGPGLIGALLIGLNAAKSLALALNKPLIGVNHIEAHLYAAIMSSTLPISFPCLGVVLSGGHTTLVKIEALGQYKIIGQTVDDAIGEAFDKVARILGLPYPGGPQIEALALKGSVTKHAFKTGKVKTNPFDFSFSGIKTGVLYAVKGQNEAKTPKNLSLEEKQDIAASFQHVAFQDVIEKTLRAAELHQISTIVFGGGVTNNKELRRLFLTKTSHLQFVWPTAGLSLDNAVMIAGLGFHNWCRENQSAPYDLEPLTSMPLN
jgi:N6-L-threonylcarbamoyladenine synthase